MGAGLSRGDEAVIERILEVASSKEVLEHPLLHRIISKWDPEDRRKLARTSPKRVSRGVQKATGVKNKCPAKSLPTTSSSLLSPSSVQPEATVSSVTSTQEDTSQRYFRRKLLENGGPEDRIPLRVSYLHKGLKYFVGINMSGRSDEFRSRIQNLWSREEGPFPASEPAMGDLHCLEALWNARDKVVDDESINSIRHCFLDIMLETVRDRISKSVILEPAPSTGQRTAGYQFVWEKMLSVVSKGGRMPTLDQLQSACRDGKRFIKMAERLGLAIFILLGKNGHNGLWTRKLGWDDLELLLSYVAETHPDLMAQASQISGLAQQVFMAGSQKFGLSPLALDDTIWGRTMQTDEWCIHPGSTQSSPAPSCKRNLAPMNISSILTRSDIMFGTHKSKYFHRVAPSRTILKSNLYMEILRLSTSCKYVFFTILSLSASYLRDVGNRYDRVALTYQKHSLPALYEALSQARDDPGSITTILAAVLLQLQYLTFTNGGLSK
ncbi:MAG: hypothetical protein M1823_001728 [Watsoniomyces obsoletus]|nr:MAG: hypothetical protein M1823_001728 [Watsoniomyces obsoletus]